MVDFIVNIFKNFLRILGWSSYGQYYCFVEGTYRLSYNKAIPSASVRADMKAAKDINVNYYQVRDKEILFFAKNLLKN